MFFFQQSGSRRGSGRECSGGSVTVISIHLSVFFQQSGSSRGSGRECRGEIASAMSIQLCVFLSIKWMQEGIREGM